MNSLTEAGNPTVPNGNGVGACIVTIPGYYITEVVIRKGHYQAGDYHLGM